MPNNNKSITKHKFLLISPVYTQTRAHTFYKFCLCWCWIFGAYHKNPLIGRKNTDRSGKNVAPNLSQWTNSVLPALWHDSCTPFVAIIHTQHTWMIVNNSSNNENYRKYQRNEFVAFRNTAQIQRIEIGEEKFCEMAIRRQCVILN